MEIIEKRIGYKFKHKKHLRQALTHSSYGYEKGAPHNERLEFLGDAILGMVIAERLFSLHPKADEGTLSKQKSAIVSEETLSKKALDLDLGPFLFLGKGEERSGGREKSSILADSVEALISAVHQDGGFEPAQRLIIKLFDEELKQNLLELKNDQDFKSLLQEKTQKMGLGYPDYKEKLVKGPEHSRIFQYQIFIGSLGGPLGEGTSKKRAQQECARKALADQTLWDNIQKQKEEIIEKGI